MQWIPAHFARAALNHDLRRIRNDTILLLLLHESDIKIEVFHETPRYRAMSVLDHSSRDAAPSERGTFDSGRWQFGLLKIVLLVLAGVLGTAFAIALDPIVNIFAEG
jgi:hypothetical protein